MTTEISHPQHDVISPENLARREYGLEVACSVDGKAAQVIIDSLVDTSSAFAHHIAASSLGGVCSRPGLDPRSRQLVTIGALTALGGYKPQLRIHIEAILNVRLIREEIIEAILHASVYVGLPWALSITLVAREIFAKRDATDRSFAPPRHMASASR